MLDRPPGAGAGPVAVMDKPKKEPILLNNQQHHYRLCLNCGFPNRQADTHCMYCQTSLVEDTGLLAWLRQTFYILRWRWQLRRKREHLQGKSGSGLGRHLGYFLVGVLLSVAGLYLFTVSVAESSFSNALIALLFLFYGGFTLRSLFARK